MDLFKTRDHVSNFDDYVTEYAELSAKTRSTLKNQIAVPYGSRPAEVMDLFFPATMTKACPIHLFIHGGYWRMFSKDDFSFIANNVTACGAIAAVMEYDLMPNVRMGVIVGQVQAAFSWLYTNAATFGGDANRLTVSGHSAGAHLATFTFPTSSKASFPKSALLLSGVYDLKPLQDSFLKPLIAITDEEVDNFSPLRLEHSPAPKTFIAYGDAETKPFADQAHEFSLHLKSQGAESNVVALSATNHMSAVRDMGSSDTVIGQMLQQVIRHS
ncbi:MAG: alpha/beta hydrolase [Aestuariivirga sp.]